MGQNMQNLIKCCMVVPKDVLHKSYIKIFDASKNMATMAKKKNIA